MLFSPFAGEAVCRRVPAPAARAGTPNMEPRYALDEAAWVWSPELRADEPAVVAFRLNFNSERAETVGLQVSADLCYVLALDGTLIARGPDTGEAGCWSFSAYDLKFAAGAHRLEALVWWGRVPQTPEARMSWRPGFACAGVGAARERFTTGVAAWRAARMQGMGWEDGKNVYYHVIGAAAVVNLAEFNLERAAWREAAVVRPVMVAHDTGLAMAGWRLEPAALPEQRHDLWRGGKVRAQVPVWPEEVPVKMGDETQEAADWNALLREGRALTLPAGASGAVLIDTDDYLCGWPVLEISGGAGARVRVQWAEALFETSNVTGPKGDRSSVAGKFFHGFGDTWIADGARRWVSSVWWRSGRYLLVSVQVSAEPLTIHTLAVERTGFPVEISAKFKSSDKSLGPVIELCERGLRSCMHEVFVDCPYYEQMMYVADTRVQMLIAYVTAGEERLPRRGMELFDWSRGRDGFTTMRFPSSYRQESATFAMIWPWMLRDFALWRDDAPWLRQRLPGMRALMEGLQAVTDEAGLLQKPPGWLFADWVPGWFAGWAPGTREGRCSALVNLQYLLTLQSAADVETWVGEPLLARRWRARAKALAKEIARKFWNKERGLWANDDGHGSFSQHAQALAVIAGLRAPKVELWADAEANGLAAATIYFQHYLFEALGQLGRTDLVLQRFDMWRNLVKQGFKTTVESPEPARSDCHAWGAHPLFHLHATVAGVRPAAPGFRKVRIAPQPGSLTRIETAIPHPRGKVKLKAKFGDARVEATVTLPKGTEGVFVWCGREKKLKAGVQMVRL